jgi:hypothetical protein
MSRFQELKAVLRKGPQTRNRPVANLTLTLGGYFVNFLRKLNYN